MCLIIAWHQFLFVVMYIYQVTLFVRILAHIKAQSQNMRIYLSLLSMLIPDLSGLRMLSSKIVFY